MKKTIARWLLRVTGWQGLGNPIAIGLWLLGIPNPALWGMLALVLRFVPYVGPIIGMVVAGLALLGLGAVAPQDFMGHFTVFVLACFVGYMVVWNVTPALHTPLMSGTNAISSIIAIGALIQVAPPLGGGAEERPDTLILGLAVAALTLTAINMFGGFAVTRRMLAMFRK